MIRPGDVVTVEFPGATGPKRRPAVVLSTATYHSTRPDVILGLLTSQTAGAVHPSDYLLQDRQQAGLRKPSLFRSFLATLPVIAVAVIGHLSDRDWKAVQERLQAAIAVT